jgi:hypothetical protein
MITLIAGMSDREQLQIDVANYVSEIPKFNAPVILDMDPTKRFRIIKFGIREELNVEIRIYSPRFLFVRWSANSHKIPAHGQERFDTISQVKKFIENNF